MAISKISNTNAIDTGAVNQAALASGVAGNGPAFKATCGVTQNLPSGTFTTVQLTSEDFDTGGCFNNTGSTVTLNGISTPAYCFAPNVAGYYWFNIDFIGSGPLGSSEVVGLIYKNASYSTVIDVVMTNYYAMTGGILLYANGTSDYFYFSAYQASGSAKTISTGASFSGNLVRSA